MSSNITNPNLLLAVSVSIQNSHYPNVSPPIQLLLLTLLIHTHSGVETDTLKLVCCCNNKDCIHLLMLIYKVNPSDVADGFNFSTSHVTIF
jgi:hypothetical protein